MSRTLYSATLGFVLVLLALSAAWPGSAVAATSDRGSLPSPLTTTIKVPSQNVNPDTYAVSDSTVVYALASPRHANMNLCPGCKPVPPPFTKFHVTFYAAALHISDGHLVASKPRAIFTEQRSWNVSIYSDLNGWVVYSRYHYYEVDGGHDWELIAHHIATGRSVVVDSPAIEGVPFGPQGARSDGHIVVFTAYAKRPGGGQNVLETYDLLTGKRSQVAEGDKFNNWNYFAPSISGDRICVEKVFNPSPKNPNATSQIVLINRNTRRIRSLNQKATRLTGAMISGNVVVWAPVSPNTGNSTGLMVDNLQTGKQRELHFWNVVTPFVIDGRYVLFGWGNQTQLRLYDVVTGANRPLVQPTKGKTVGRASGSQHTALYEAYAGKAGNQLIVARLP